MLKTVRETEEKEGQEKPCDCAGVRETADENMTVLVLLSVFCVV